MIDTIKVNHIVATDLDGCIGKDNQLMWHIPADLRRFKSLTEGGVVVMGRKTFESLGCKPLPTRVNIVITSDYYYGLAHSPTEVIFYTDIDFALDRAKYEASKLGVKEVWIIGGQSIYEQTMPYVDKIVKTVVYNRFNGDTFYQIPVDMVEESSRSVVYKDNESELNYQFITYRSIKENPVINDNQRACSGSTSPEFIKIKIPKGTVSLSGTTAGRKMNPICNHCKHDYTGHQLEIVCMDENNNCQLCRAALSGKFADGQGRKDDSNKPRYSLLPTGTVSQVIQVMEYGAVKYDPGNWKLVENARTRYYDAAMRHIDDWWNGSTTDSESSLPHLAHAICCLLFLMWFDDQE